MRAETRAAQFALLFVLALMSCGPPRPTDAQVRAAITEAVQARADRTTVTIEELEVREWAEVQPGVVWVRVFVRCATDSPDAWSVTDAGLEWMKAEWRDNRALRQGVVLTFDLQQRDADWHVVRDWRSDVTEETE